MYCAYELLAEHSPTLYKSSVNALQQNYILFKERVLNIKDLKG